MAEGMFPSETELQRQEEGRASSLPAGAIAAKDASGSNHQGGSKVLSSAHLGNLSLKPHLELQHQLQQERQGQEVKPLPSAHLHAEQRPRQRETAGSVDWSSSSQQSMTTASFSQAGKAAGPASQQSVSGFSASYSAASGGGAGASAGGSSIQSSMGAGRGRSNISIVSSGTQDPLFPPRQQALPNHGSSTARAASTGGSAGTVLGKPVLGSGWSGSWSSSSGTGSGSSLGKGKGVERSESRNSDGSSGDGSKASGSSRSGGSGNSSAPGNTSFSGGSWSRGSSVPPAEDGSRQPALHRASKPSSGPTRELEAAAASVLGPRHHILPSSYSPAPASASTYQQMQQSQQLQLQGEGEEEGIDRERPVFSFAEPRGPLSMRLVPVSVKPAGAAAAAAAAEQGGGTARSEDAMSIETPNPGLASSAAGLQVERQTGNLSVATTAVAAAAAAAAFASPTSQAAAAEGAAIVEADNDNREEQEQSDWGSIIAAAVATAGTAAAAAAARAAGGALAACKAPSLPGSAASAVLAVSAAGTGAPPKRVEEVALKDSAAALLLDFATSLSARSSSGSGGQGTAIIAAAAAAAAASTAGVPKDPRPGATVPLALQNGVAGRAMSRFSQDSSSRSSTSSKSRSTGSGVSSHLQDSAPTSPMNALQQGTAAAAAGAGEDELQAQALLQQQQKRGKKHRSSHLASAAIGGYGSSISDTITSDSSSHGAAAVDATTAAAFAGASEQQQEQQQQTMQDLRLQLQQLEEQHQQLFWRLQEQERGSQVHNSAEEGLVMQGAHNLPSHAQAAMPAVSQAGTHIAPGPASFSSKSSGRDKRSNSLHGTISSRGSVSSSTAVAGLGGAGGNGELAAPAQDPSLTEETPQLWRSSSRCSTGSDSSRGYRASLYNSNTRPASAGALSASAAGAMSGPGLHFQQDLQATSLDRADAGAEERGSGSMGGPVPSYPVLMHQLISSSGALLPARPSTARDGAAAMARSVSAEMLAAQQGRGVLSISASGSPGMLLPSGNGNGQGGSRAGGQHSASSLSRGSTTPLVALPAWSKDGHKRDASSSSSQRGGGGKGSMMSASSRMLQKGLDEAAAVVNEGGQQWHQQQQMGFAFDSAGESGSVSSCRKNAAGAGGAAAAVTSGPGPVVPDAAGLSSTQLQQQLGQAFAASQIRASRSGSISLSLEGSPIVVMAEATAAASAPVGTAFQQQQFQQYQFMVRQHRHYQEQQRQQQQQQQQQGLPQRPSSDKARDSSGLSAFSPPFFPHQQLYGGNAAIANAGGAVAAATAAEMAAGVSRSSSSLSNKSSHPKWSQRKGKEPAGRPGPGRRSRADSGWGAGEDGGSGGENDSVGSFYSNSQSLSAPRKRAPVEESFMHAVAGSSSSSFLRLNNMTELLEKGVAATAPEVSVFLHKNQQIMSFLPCHCELCLQSTDARMLQEENLRHSEEERGAPSAPAAAAAAGKRLPSCNAFICRWDPFSAAAQAAAALHSASNAAAGSRNGSNSRGTSKEKKEEGSAMEEETEPASFPSAAPQDGGSGDGMGMGDEVQAEGEAETGAGEEDAAAPSSSAAAAAAGSASGGTVPKRKMGEDDKEKVFLFYSAVKQGRLLLPFSQLVPCVTALIDPRRSKLYYERLVVRRRLKKLLLEHFEMEQPAAAAWGSSAATAALGPSSAHHSKNNTPGLAAAAAATPADAGGGGAAVASTDNEASEDQHLSTAAADEEVGSLLGGTGGSQQQLGAPKPFRRNRKNHKWTSTHKRNWTSQSAAARAKVAADKLTRAAASVEAASTSTGEDSSAADDTPATAAYAAPASLALRAVAGNKKRSREAAGLAEERMLAYAHAAVPAAPPATGGRGKGAGKGRHPVHSSLAAGEAEEEEEGEEASGSREEDVPGVDLQEQESGQQQQQQMPWNALLPPSLMVPPVGVPPPNVQTFEAAAGSAPGDSLLRLVQGGGAGTKLSYGGWEEKLSPLHAEIDPKVIAEYRRNLLSQLQLLDDTLALTKTPHALSAGPGAAATASVQAHATAVVGQLPQLPRLLLSNLGSSCGLKSAGGPVSKGSSGESTITAVLQGSTAAPSPTSMFLEGDSRMNSSRSTSRGSSGGRPVAAGTTEALLRSSAASAAALSAYKKQRALTGDPMALLMPHSAAVMQPSPGSPSERASGRGKGGKLGKSRLSGGAAGAAGMLAASSSSGSGSAAGQQLPLASASSAAGDGSYFMQAVPAAGGAEGAAAAAAGAGGMRGLGGMQEAVAGGQAWASMPPANHQTHAAAAAAAHTSAGSGGPYGTAPMAPAPLPPFFRAACSSSPPPLPALPGAAGGAGAGPVSHAAAARAATVSATAAGRAGIETVGATSMSSARGELTARAFVNTPRGAPASGETHVAFSSASSAASSGAAAGLTGFSSALQVAESSAHLQEMIVAEQQRLQQAHHQQLQQLLMLQQIEQANQLAHLRGSGPAAAGAVAAAAGSSGPSGSSLLSPHFSNPHVFLPAGPGGTSLPHMLSLQPGMQLQLQGGAGQLLSAGSGPHHVSTPRPAFAPGPGPAGGSLGAGGAAGGLSGAAVRPILPAGMSLHASEELAVQRQHQQQASLAAAASAAHYFSALQQQQQQQQQRQAQGPSRQQRL